MQGVSGSNPLGSIGKTTVLDKVFSGRKAAFLLPGQAAPERMHLKELMPAIQSRGGGALDQSSVRA